MKNGDKFLAELREKSARSYGLKILAATRPYNIDDILNLVCNTLENKN